MEDKASRDVSLGAMGAPKGFENQSISIMSYHVCDSCETHGLLHIWRGPSQGSTQFALNGSTVPMASMAMASMAMASMASMASRQVRFSNNSNPADVLQKPLSTCPPLIFGLH